jgi:hypothetical protein
MNYIKHLTGFFDKVVYDYDLNPTHISMYVALFQIWNVNRFENPISISRDEVMRISKICSKATYHKCMKELHEKEYIKYEPSYNPFKGSLVRMINLSSELKPKRKRAQTIPKNKQLIEQPLNKQKTSTETGTEQALVSYINIINNTNNANIANLGEQAKSLKSNQFKNLLGSENAVTKKKLREKKVKEPKIKIPPDWSEVETFFKEKKISVTEAEKFFNYFQSNGWLVGGKTQMKNWEAAARNWILNSDKFRPKETFKTLRPDHLHVKTDKNYGEPL